MNKLLFLLLFLLPVLISNYGNAQGLYPTGAASIGMANASVNNEDVWAYHNNPGALGYITQTTVGVSYQNRFASSAIQSQSLAFAYKLKTGALSFGANNFGNTNLKVYKAGLGYSMKLDEKLSAGVQLNYQGIRLPTYYGSKNTLTAEFGFLAKINASWKFGFSVFNIGRAKLSTYEDDRLSTNFRIGTTYNPSNKLAFTVEADKEIDYKIRFKGGMQYEAFENFYVRTGVANNPIEISVGFGYKFHNFQLDIASAYHQLLGFSPALSFNYLFDKK